MTKLPNAAKLGGEGLKSSAFSAIPLCSAHHRGAGDSYHRLRKHCFAQEHRD